MKKLISLCISFATALSVITAMSVPGAAKNNKAEELMRNMGYITEDYASEDILTRAEFADIMVRVLRLGDENHDGKLWFDEVLGDNFTEKEVTIGKNVFDDVDASHPYSYQIQLVKQHGIMKGVSERLFAPEYSLTLKEAEKVILDLMGYGVYAEWQGGYPAGYTMTAASIGLDLNVDKEPGAVLTVSALATLIYNAMDINLIEISDFANKTYSESDETFMTGVMDMGKVKGRLTDNGYTAMDGATQIGKGKITVNGVTAYIGENLKNAVDFIGREVQMYYYINDDDENVAICIELTDDSAITFDIDDFESFKDGVISFYINDKFYSKTVDSDVEMIINNEVQPYFSESTFDFADGDVTLIKGDRNICLIVVQKYEYAVVSNVDKKNGYIFNKFTGKGILSKYDLSGADIEEENIFISDSTGKKLTIDDIEVGDVLNIRKSSEYMYITKAGEKVDDFKVTGIEKDEDKTLYSGVESEYETSEFMTEIADQPQVSIGKVYRLYLNIFGKIVWIENVSEGMNGYVGILTDAYYKEEEDDGYQRMVRIYTTDSELVRYFPGEKIRFNGKNAKFENIVDDLTNNIGTAILYTLDADKNLTGITIANPFGDRTETGWYRLISGTDLTYEGQGGAFNTLVYNNKSTTKVFTVPLDEELYKDKENFSVGKTSFADNQKYTFEAYASHPDAVTADVIVLKKEASSGGTIIERAAFLIADVENTINADDEPIIKLSGYAFSTGASKYKEYIVNEDAIMVDFGSGGIGKEIPADGKVEEVGPRTYKELEPGDIIYYNTDINDRIDIIRIAYDLSTGKAFNAGRGNDFYDPKNNGTYSSPTNTTWAGTAISRVGDGVRLAINKNPGAIDFTSLTSVTKNVVAVRLSNANAIMIVEKNGKKLDVRQGTVNDVVTYNETHSKEDSDEIVSLAYWRAGNYATVIYK